MSDNYATDTYNFDADLFDIGDTKISDIPMDELFEGKNYDQFGQNMFDLPEEIPEFPEFSNDQSDSFGTGTPSQNDFHDFKDSPDTQQDSSWTAEDSTTVEEHSINRASKKITKYGKSLNHLQEYQSFLAQVDPKYIPNELYDPSIDDKTKKKLIHMIRNRLAAKKSRDKKSQYLTELELQKEKLHSHLKGAQQKNQVLSQQFIKLRDAHKALNTQHMALKSAASNFNCTSCGQNLNIKNILAGRNGGNNMNMGNLGMNQGMMGQQGQGQQGNNSGNQQNLNLQMLQMKIKMQQQQLENQQKQIALMKNSVGGNNMIGNNNTQGNNNQMFPKQGQLNNPNTNKNPNNNPLFAPQQNANLNLKQSNNMVGEQNNAVNMQKLQMLMRCKASNAKSSFGSFTLGICMIICTVATVPLGEITMDYDKYGCHESYRCYTKDSQTAMPYDTGRMLEDSFLGTRQLYLYQSGKVDKDNSFYNGGASDTIVDKNRTIDGNQGSEFFSDSKAKVLKHLKDHLSELVTMLVLVISMGGGSLWMKNRPARQAGYGQLGGSSIEMNNFASTEDDDKMLEDDSDDEF